MSAKDLYHDQVVRALQKDGWTITHDPLTIPFGRTEIFVDIGAERLLAAERNGERIAVEVKSFLNLSPIKDLKEALGQFVLYSGALEDSETEADRVLFLAIRDEVYDDVFSDRAIERLIQRKSVRLIVFSAETEEIKRWIK
jgi:hypothetical protein